MSTEELLQPRYKVIADYPDSPFKKEEILVQHDQSFAQQRDGGFMIAVPEWYPNIFKYLEWWEEREMSDMPEYYKWGTQIYKRKSYVKYIVSDYDGTFPATEQEYNEYQNKVNKQIL